MVRAAMTSGHLMPGQIRVSEMNGTAVYDNQNRNSGKIKDVILDPDGRVAAVILNVGGILELGARYVAVGIDNLKVTNDNAKPRFTVDMSKDQLKTAQTYDLNEADPAGSTTPPAQSSR
jgi:sporulation protein YlmC with PRC-barrel domain